MIFDSPPGCGCSGCREESRCGAGRNIGAVVRLPRLRSQISITRQPPGSSDRQRRYGRAALLATLVAGMLLGALAVGIAYLFPADPDVAGTSFWSGLRTFLTQYRRLLMLPVAGCAIALGLLIGRDRSRVRI